MDSIKILTILESAYLFFMYFLYKTTYTFGKAKYDKETQSLGSLFVHDTNTYENKVCTFGKIMAVIAIGLAALRLYYVKTTSTTTIIASTAVFGLICIFLAINMNFTAFVYISPLIFTESLLLYLISNLKEERKD